jgi:hypothetical protein
MRAKYLPQHTAYSIKYEKLQSRALCFSTLNKLVSSSPTPSMMNTTCQTLIVFVAVRVRRKSPSCTAYFVKHVTLSLENNQMMRGEVLGGVTGAVW